MSLEWKSLMDKQAHIIHLGEEAFSRWKKFMSERGFGTDAEMALFVLDWCAASTQNHDPASETSGGRPPHMKKDIPDLTPHNVCVNIACLLQLFWHCGQCSGECVVRKQGDKRHFTVIQHCQICNLLTTWTSQPFKEDEESLDLNEVTEGNRDFTSSLMMHDRKTDTASSMEERVLTDEDIKIIRPAEVVWESVARPCEVREGDQESTASTMMTTMTDRSQTDGGPSRKTSLLTKDEKKRKAQESKNIWDPFAVVEQTIDSNLSDESQRSQKEEGEEADEKVEEGMENIKEEDREESETGEEEDKWKMDDDDEETEGEMDEVRSVRKRLRDDDPDPQGQQRKKCMLRKYMMNYRRKYMMKRDQKRPETHCTVCGLLYKTMSHKCDPKNKYQCPDCGVSFLTELSLSVHRNNHHRSGSHYHPCTFCLKPFKTRHDKLTHEMSHSGEKPYECPECPQRFTNRSTRSRHLKEQHPKRFTCQICQKEFPNLAMLQRHEMSHSANKPFKCQMCDRVFAQASQLKSHLRVHTGEKPFQCQLCTKCFNHNISLKNHIKRYHQDENHDNPARALREQGEG